MSIQSAWQKSFDFPGRKPVVVRPMDTALSSDPVFKLIASRQPSGPDLASQPTLSRFENSIRAKSLFRLRDVLIDQFIASFEKPPQRLTLDIDPFDDPTHGQQFFHGNGMNKPG